VVGNCRATPLKVTVLSLRTTRSCLADSSKVGSRHRCERTLRLGRGYAEAPVEVSHEDFF
jgi:hypothetical protein